MTGWAWLGQAASAAGRVEIGRRRQDARSRRAWHTASMEWWQAAEGSAWFEAAAAGDAAQLRAGLASGARIDAKDAKGWTAAMHAGWMGRLECLALLIEAGCDVDAKSRSRWTAARWAAFEDERDCLAALLRAGCDVEAPDDKGQTIAMRAAWMGLAECLQMLIEAGCELEGVDAEGATIDELARLSAEHAGEDRAMACARRIQVGREARALSKLVGRGGDGAPPAGAPRL